jgi:hypothetical protein
MTDLIVEIEGKGDPEFGVQSGFALMSMSRNSGVWAAYSPRLKRSRQNFRLLNNPARFNSLACRWRQNLHVYPYTARLVRPERPGGVKVNRLYIPRWHDPTMRSH